jgi:hypothetical protein
MLAGDRHYFGSFTDARGVGKDILFIRELDSLPDGSPVVVGPTYYDSGTVFETV